MRRGGIRERGRGLFALLSFKDLDRGDVTIIVLLRIVGSAADHVLVLFAAVNFVALGLFDEFQEPGDLVAHPCVEVCLRGVDVVLAELAEPGQELDDAFESLVFYVSLKDGYAGGRRDVLKAKKPFEYCLRSTAYFSRPAGTDIS